MASAKTTKGRILRYTLLAVGVLVLLVLLVLVLATLPPGERVIKGIIEEQASSALHQPVTIGAFETNLFSRIRLEEVRVAPGKPDSGGLFISAVEVHYRLWPLLGGTLVLKSATVDSAEVLIVRDSAHGFNLAILDSLAASADTAGRQDAAETGGGFSFVLGPVGIRHLDLRYADESLPISATLPGVSLQLEETGQAGLAFELRSDTGMVTYAEYPEIPVALYARGAWADNIVAADTLRITLGDILLETGGVISMGETMLLDLSVQLRGEPGAFVHGLADQLDMPELATDGELVIDADIEGPAALPQGTVRVNLPTVHTSQATVRDGYLQFSRRNDTLALDSLRASLLGGTVIAGGRMLIDTVLNGRLHVALESLDLPQIWSLAYDTASPYEGAISGQVEANLNGVAWTTWSLTANLRAQNVVYRGNRLQDVAIELDLDTGRVRADIRQQYFTINASVGLADSLLSGTVQADIQQLGLLAGWFNVGEMQGALSASADLSGTLDNPSVQARVQGNNLRYEGFPIDSLLTTLRYANSRLVIEQLTAKGSAAAYRAIESIRSKFGAAPAHSLMVGVLAQAPEPDDADDPPAETTKAMPDPLFGIESLFGGIDYTLNLSGPLDSLQGSLQADLTGIEYEGYTIDSGNVNVRIDINRLVFDTLRIYRESLLIQVGGFYDTESGNGSAAARVYSRNAEPDTATPLPETRIALPDPPDAYAPVGILESDFTYSTIGSFTVEAQGQRFELGALGALLPDTTAMGGVADFTISARGPVDSLVADLELVVDQPRYDAVELDSVHVAGSFNRGNLQVRNLGAWRLDQFLSGQFSARLSRDTAGAWTVTKTTPVRGMLEMEEFNLGVAGPFLPEGAALAGFMWLDLQFDGTMSDPNVTGTLQIDSALYSWAADGDTVRNINVTGTIADSTFTIDTARALINEIPLAMGGTVTLASDSRISMDLAITVDTAHTIAAQGTLAADSLDFTAQIDSLNLRVLEPFVPMVDSIGGYLSAQVELGGSLEDLQMDGRMTATGVIVKPEILSEPLTGGWLEARFTADRLIIDTLTAELGTGNIGAAGAMQFDTTGLADIDMVFNADSATFTAMEDIEVMIERMRLTYEPSGEYYELGGVIDFGRVEYKTDFQIIELLPFTQDVQQVETELPPLLARTRLNVQVVNSDQLWMDNNLAKLRLDADAQIVGSMPDPNLTGRVVVEEGYILYLDRKFEVLEGTAYFIDPNEINPEVTLQAEAEVTAYQQTQATTYKISLMVTDRLQSPRVELTSDPQLSRPDIVSLLTLGATRQQLTGRTGNILQERAESIASGQIAGYAAGRLGSALGLDRVTVTGNIFDLSDTTGPELIVAKELSEDVTLTYRTSVGHLNDQEVNVTWQLSRWWLLEGTTTRNGESALSLTYALRFR